MVTNSSFYYTNPTPDEINTAQSLLDEAIAVAQGAATDSADSATLSQQWATQTGSEVVSGQGYGSKKYSQDASASATAAASSASSAASSAASASTSAANSASSSTASAASASSSATNATNAATSASAAATSATNASNSASLASTSALNAANSETNAANSYNSFHNIYYGPSASAPTTRPDGSARVNGDLYYNTGANQLYVYTSSGWSAAYLSAATGGALIAINNLSDLTSASTARSNLGLGGSATLNVGTSAGTVAAGDDSRITGAAQKASNLSDLASASTARTNLGLGGAATLNVGTTTGTVAAGDDSRITGAAQKASNLSDLANAATARTNLGLGSAATLASTAVAQTANNLSDLASASTARTNLGLGTAATLASTAVAQTANNLSDLASVATARTNLGLGGLATVTPGTGVATAAGNAVNATGGFITYTTYAPATGKTLTVSNSLTLAGTDGTTLTFPSVSATVAGLGVAQSYTKAQSFTPYALTDGASISWDVSLGQKASVTLGGNRTMSAVSNIVAGTTYYLFVTQDATGSRTLSWTTGAANGNFDFGTAGAPILSTAASTLDVLAFEAVTVGSYTKMRYLGIMKGYT